MKPYYIMLGIMFGIMVARYITIPIAEAVYPNQIWKRIAVNFGILVVILFLLIAMEIML